MQLVIDGRGRVHCLYTETMDLTALGRLSIRRAGLVEPDTNGRWQADLAPVGGPLLGPFAWRSEALVAEQDWLETYWLPGLGVEERRDQVGASV